MVHDEDINFYAWMESLEPAEEQEFNLQKDDKAFYDILRRSLFS